MNNSIVLALNAINKNRVDLGSHNIELNKLQDF